MNNWPKATELVPGGCGIQTPGGVARNAQHGLGRHREQGPRTRRLEKISQAEMGSPGGGEECGPGVLPPVAQALHLPVSGSLGGVSECPAHS